MILKSIELTVKTDYHTSLHVLICDPKGECEKSSRNARTMYSKLAWNSLCLRMALKSSCLILLSVGITNVCQYTWFQKTFQST